MPSSGVAIYAAPVVLKGKPPISHAPTPVIHNHEAGIPVMNRNKYSVMDC